MAIFNRKSWLVAAAISIVCVVLVVEPAQAQFRDLLPSVTRDVVRDAQSSDAGCEEGKKKSAGSKILGGLFGRATRRAASSTGVTRWVPISGVSDQLTDAIACRLDPEEQKQAAEATLKATRSDVSELGEGGEETGEGQETEEGEVVDTGPAIGSSASWTSNTRDDVSGSSTVVARSSDGDGGLDCITVTDVIIVKGEETTANKRMCRPPGSRRYSLVA